MVVTKSLMSSGVPKKVESGSRMRKRVSRKMEPQVKRRIPSGQVRMDAKPKRQRHLMKKNKTQYHSSSSDDSENDETVDGDNDQSSPEQNESYDEEDDHTESRADEIGESDGEGGNVGWADAMSRVLNMASSNKTVKDDNDDEGKISNLVARRPTTSDYFLAKAIPDHEIERRKLTKENNSTASKDDSDQIDVDETKKTTVKESRKMSAGDAICIQSSALFKTLARERRLRRIASFGVVHLFNAVREQQSNIKNRVVRENVEQSVFGRERVMADIQSEMSESVSVKASVPDDGSINRVIEKRVSQRMAQDDGARLLNEANLDGGKAKMIDSDDHDDDEMTDSYDDEKYGGDDDKIFAES